MESRSGPEPPCWRGCLSPRGAAQGLRSSSGWRLLWWHRPASRIRSVSIDRRCIDYRAALLHVRNSRFGQVKHPVNVHPERPLPFLVRNILDSFKGRLVRRVVDENVYVAMPADRRRRSCGNVRTSQHRRIRSRFFDLHLPQAVVSLSRRPARSDRRMSYIRPFACVRNGKHRCWHP